MKPHRRQTPKQMMIADLRELVVDNFAGGGGASTGIALAIGRSVDVAINHDEAAIAMHRTNHPDTKHYCESVWDVDPRKVTRGVPVGLAWFSPDCTHFSKAKGGKPVSKKIRGLAWVAVRWAATVKPRVIMLENVEEFITWGPLIATRDPKTNRLLKKVLGHGEDGEKWAIVVAEPGETVPPELRVMHPDPKRKGREFRVFVNALRRQGYHVEWRELRACDYGAPTIRKRLFLIARCDGRPIVWPQPTHGDPKSEAVKSGKLKPWRTAAEIIDWSLPCPSIFDRERPLAENTLRRIARGIQKFVLNNPNPFVIRLSYMLSQMRERTVDEPLQTITAKNDLAVVHPFVIKVNHSKDDHFRGQAIDEPMQTITAKNGWGIVAPTLIQMGYGEREGQEPRVLDLGKPLGTVTAGGNKFAIAAAYLDRQFTRSVGHGADEPVGTVTAGGSGKTNLVTATLATSHILKLYGTATGHRTDEPLHTVTASGFHLGEVRTFLQRYLGPELESHPEPQPMACDLDDDGCGCGSDEAGEMDMEASDKEPSAPNPVMAHDVRAFLLKYYGSNVGQQLDEPLHTVTSRARFGLVTVEGQDYQIVDIGMRMLEPHELFAANGFPANYIIDHDDTGKRYSKAAQIARCGNAVPPQLARALVAANVPELRRELRPTAVSV